MDAHRVKKELRTAYKSLNCKIFLHYDSLEKPKFSKSFKDFKKELRIAYKS